MTKKPDLRLSRRGLLSAGGAAIAGAPLAMASMTGSAGATEDGYDVIVVGGGFAGCTASRELAENGLKTLLLEARAILGGRTETGEFNGHLTELGGTWIHWTQPNVWAEINRYGLDLKESAGAVPDTCAWMYGDGQVRTEPSGVFLEKFTVAMQKFCDVDGWGSATVFPQAHAPFATDTWKQYDSMTCWERLDQIEIDAEERAMLNAWISICSHNDPKLAGFVDMLKWYSLGDFNVGLLWDRAGHYKIAKGTSHLIEKIVEDGGAEIRLSTAVAKIEQNADGVVVTTEDGEAISAKRLICTVPLNTLNNVVFEPPLMAAKTKASEKGHTGRGFKFYFKIDKDVGNYLATAPHPDFPLAMFWTEYAENGETVMVGFGAPTDLDLLDPDELTPLIRKFIPEATVLDTMGFPWADDPYIAGTWCFFYPNQFGESLEALQAPEGHVHFASGDSANGWRGFIDGAIERGNRVARIIIEDLQAV